MALEKESQNQANTKMSGSYTFMELPIDKSLRIILQWLVLTSLRRIHHGFCRIWPLPHVVVDLDFDLILEIVVILPDLYGQPVLGPVFERSLLKR